ncbi:MAG TPA: hypothetical protein VKC60_06215 [Opitutaceae bacterium]|nr:hypothetical protein [Opitutaceae bacterium]
MRLSSLITTTLALALSVTGIRAHDCAKEKRPVVVTADFIADGLLLHCTANEGARTASASAKGITVSVELKMSGDNPVGAKKDVRAQGPQWQATARIMSGGRVIDSIAIDQNRDSLRSEIPMTSGSAAFSIYTSL